MGGDTAFEETFSQKPTLVECKISEPGLGINPSTQEAEASLEFKVSLVYAEFQDHLNPVSK